MASVVKSRVVRIGNSRGVRLPKVLLGNLRPGDEVELAVQRGRLIVRPARKPREGWDEAFRRMAELRDDRFVAPTAPTRWDEEEWEW